MDITARVKLVMEDMTTLVTTSMAMIIAGGRVIMGKYPGEVTIKIATNQTKLLHVQFTSRVD